VHPIKATVKGMVPDPVRHSLKERMIDRSLVRSMFSTRSELDGFRSEFDELLGILEEQHRRFREEFTGTTARGHPMSFGNLAWEPAARIYALIRKRRPDRCVETGVCNGVSTSVILLALERNRNGRLWSIDYPEYSDAPVGDFSDTKRGAIVPAGRQPGWLVPDNLRGRWELSLGKSQEELAAACSPGRDRFLHARQRALLREHVHGDFVSF